MNTNWPFAQLTVTEKELVLQVPLYDPFVFKPVDIEQIEPYGRIPYLTKGVQLHHRVITYPQKIIFWCACFDPTGIVNSIRASGYGIDSPSTDSDLK